MPFFRHPVQVELLPGNTQLRLTVNSQQRDIDLSDLLDRGTFRSQQMIRNMRIARSEAGGPGLESAQFYSAVNNVNKGMELANRRYFIHSTAYNSDGTITIRFSETSNGPWTQTVTVDPLEFEDLGSETPLDIVQDNLASWLRIEGVDNVSELTPAILARLNAQRFYA